MASSHDNRNLKINQRSKALATEFRKDRYSPHIYEYPAVFRFSEVVKFYSGKSAQDCILLELTIAPVLRERIQRGEEDLKKMARFVAADIMQRYQEHLTVDTVYYNYFDRITIFYHHRSRFSPNAQRKVYGNKKMEKYGKEERKTLENKAWARPDSRVSEVGGKTDSGIESSPEKQQGDIEDKMFNGQSVKVCVLRTSSSTQTETDEEHQHAKSTIKRNEEKCDSSTIDKSEADKNENVQKDSKPERKRNEIDVDYASIEKDMRKNIMISKFRENESFNRSRKYLAYFTKFKETCYEGESYLSIQTYLRNEGMFTDDVTFENNYYGFLQEYGFNKQQIDTDLKNLYNQMSTNRMLRMEQCSRLTQAHLRGDRSVRVIGQGRFDTECCTLI